VRRQRELAQLSQADYAQSRPGWVVETSWFTVGLERWLLALGDHPDFVESMLGQTLKLSSASAWSISGCRCHT
jgi:hypothetical protein